MKHLQRLLLLCVFLAACQTSEITGVEETAVSQLNEIAVELEMPPSDLIGTAWQLAAAGDEAADMFLPNPPAWLRFSDNPDPNGNPGFSFEGFSGCNTLFSSYLVAANMLMMDVGMTSKIGNLFYTKLMMWKTWNRIKLI